MKTPLAALFLAVPPVHGDRASAHAAPAKEGIPFTPEAFLTSVAEGNAAHVTLLLEAGIDPAVPNAAKRTALWIAVERKQPAALAALLAGGVAPNEHNAPVLEYGKTIVSQAVDSGDPALVRALVEAGADARKVNEYGVPPLAEAARVGNLEMCRILLKGGADPNAAPGGYPLLFGPVNENHPEVVRLLLQSGARLGEHKAALLEAAKAPEVRALLEAAE